MDIQETLPLPEGTRLEIAEGQSLRAEIVGVKVVKKRVILTTTLGETSYFPWQVSYHRLVDRYGQLPANWLGKQVSLLGVKERGFVNAVVL